MSTPQASFLQCSPEIIGGLIETVSAALCERFPQPSADLDDIDDIIDALRVLKPKLAELDMFTGMTLMLRGNWQESARVFAALVEARPDFEQARAMLAFYYSIKGRDEWRHLALESEDPAIQDLMRGLHAREDFLKAIREARSAGKPVEVPDSVKSFVASAVAQGNSTETAAAAQA